MVEAIGYQLDRCDVCGKKVHRRDLVRTQVEFLAAEGSNYLNYSSYNVSGWTIRTAADAGVISIGPYADRARVRVADDNTLTEILGSQTMTGTGALTTDQGIDASSWTSLVFAVDVGPYHRSTSPELTVVLSLCDSDGSSNLETLATFTTKGDMRAWGTIDIADMPASKSSSELYFRVDVTPATGEKWWVDRMQVAKDMVKLGTFVPTSGASVDRIDTTMMTMRKVCTNCRERILSKTEQRGKIAEIRTEQPVDIMNQEF